VIRYALACAAGHAFEAWFAGSQAYEEQKAAGSLACPLCGSVEVEKALMRPAVASGAEEPVRVAANVPQHAAEMAAMVRKLREHLTEKAEYVGDRFPEEARRIHYQEVEKRGIYGEATAAEARALVDEGIEFHPLPRLPEDMH
jgi:hypothetical protein